MNGRAFNPGNINVRLGSVLQKIEDALAVGDLATASNLMDLAADYLSVYMAKGEWETYDAMPGLTYGDSRTHAEVHRALGARRRYLLAIARRAGVFARAADPVTGDSDYLDQEDTATSAIEEVSA